MDPCLHLASANHLIMFSFNVFIKIKIYEDNFFYKRNEFNLKVALPELPPAVVAHSFPGLIRYPHEIVFFIPWLQLLIIDIQFHFYNLNKINRKEVFSFSSGIRPLTSTKHVFSSTQLHAHREYPLVLSICLKMRGTVVQENLCSSAFSK